MIMKFRSLTVLSLLAGTVLLIGSCKKDAISNKSTDSTKIGAQLAVSLYQSLNTAFNSKSGLVTSSASPRRTTLADNLCGTLKEVPVNEVTTQGDTVKDTYTGYYKYVYNCDGNNTVNGYTQADSIVNAGFNPAKTYNRLVKEYLTVTQLEADFAKLGVSGNQYSLITSQSKTNSAESSTQTNNFTLTNLVLVPGSNKIAITSGTTTFTCAGTTDGTAFSYTGTITFLADYKAKVEFDGKVIIADLLTGDTAVQ
jgi:hypothetical protein